MVNIYFIKVNLMIINLMKKVHYIIEMVKNIMKELLKTEKFVEKELGIIKMVQKNSKEFLKIMIHLKENILIQKIKKYIKVKY